MSKFELNYKHEVAYEEKIDLEIRLQVRPKKEDYQDMLTAIETLDKIREKYLPVPKKQTEPKKS